MAIENEGNTSRPGVVIIAIIALLLVAGIAIWFTTRQPAIERDTSTTTTTTGTSTYETQSPAPSGSGTMTEPSGEQTEGGASPSAPPDSTTP